MSSFFQVSKFVILLGVMFSFVGMPASAETTHPAVSADLHDRVPRPGARYRLPRPHNTADFTQQSDGHQLAAPNANFAERAESEYIFASNANSQTSADAGMLGQYIYPNMRTAMPRDSFETWRQEYCDPFLCNMVLCNGSCKAFAEHCPSLSDSARVIHIYETGCADNSPPCDVSENDERNRLTQNDECSNLNHASAQRTPISGYSPNLKNFCEAKAARRN